MIKTKHIVYSAVIAALYVALTWVVHPIAYGPVQFRVAEVLKSLVIWFPPAIPGFALGNFIANLGSPFGLLELTLMPAANLVGGWLCWRIGQHNKWAGAAVFALVISVGVATVLNTALAIPWLGVFCSVLFSEALLIIGGVSVMERIGAAILRK